MGIHKWLIGREAKLCVGDDLIKTLEEIGRLKNLCSHTSSQAELAELSYIDPTSAASRGLFNVLGLYVQLLSSELPISVTHREHSIDGWTLQAGEQGRAHLEAWRAESEDDWNVVKYKAGKWENLVSPTLELAKHIPNISGSIPEKVQTIQEIASNWKETGQIKLSPSRFTCGKCGAVVNNADEHIRFHLYNLEGKPLFSNVAVKDGNVSLLVGKGFQPFEDSVFIDPQEYDLDCEEPGFSRLQSELIQMVTRQKGTLEDGLHSLPEDISAYPAIAQALSTYVQVHFPTHWEGGL